MVTVSSKAFIHKGLRAYPNCKKARLRMVILVTTGELLGLTKIEKQDNKPIIIIEILLLSDNYIVDRYITISLETI